MKLEGEGKLLRIFIGESDRPGRKPLYQAIVEVLREEGLVTLERVQVVAYRAPCPGGRSGLLTTMGAR